MQPKELCGVRGPIRNIGGACRVSLGLGSTTEILAIFVKSDRARSVGSKKNGDTSYVSMALSLSA